MTAPSVKSRDAMRLDSPAAQAELQYLKTFQVGDTRVSPLLPALETDVHWVCQEATKDRWVFEGLFCNQPLFTLTIRVDAALLTLEVR